MAFTARTIRAPSRSREPGQQRLEFLTGWIQAQQALGPDGKLNEMKPAFLIELDEVWESVVDLELSETFYAPLARRSLLQRLFLLYAPVTPSDGYIMPSIGQLLAL